MILRKCINRKDIINSYNVVINEKNSQGEEYTAGCLLDYGYAKNH